MDLHVAVLGLGTMPIKHIGVICQKVDLPREGSVILTAKLSPSLPASHHLIPTQTIEDLSGLS